MIRFDNVSFSYGPADRGIEALSAVDFSLEPGRMLAVLGANGSGKSTLARLTNGLLLPTRGRVVVDGIDTTDDERSFDLRSRVGMVFQNPDDQIVATAVEDDVAFGPENLGLERSEIRRRVDDALEAVGLAGLERREPHLLSGGQKQRLAIAGALAMLPRYLVLDEPTAMIDAQGRADVASVLERVRRSGHAVLLITHDLSEAAGADEVLVLHRGSVVFRGTVEALVADAGRLTTWGLELPPAARLGGSLRGFGVPVPATAFDPVAIAEALWA